MKTNHYSLKYLLDQWLATISQHQWVSKLMGFDFAVEYKTGASNTAVDALSRLSEEESGALAALSAPMFTVFDTLRMELDEVVALRQLRDEIAAGGHEDQWQVVGSLITRTGKVYVLADSPHLPAVHDMGHKGAEKILHRLRRDFYVSGARSAVQEHVCACAMCQQNKVKQLHPVGLLQPLDVPSIVWTHIAMDFVEGFPRINGKSVILMVIERFSKYAHFVPIGHPYMAISVAKVFFDSVVRLHEILKSIVSDRDPVFTSKFWMELFTLSGVKLQLSSAFHPQSDG
jgi:hypothetical protein